MNLAPEEKEDIKSMLQFLVDKKAESSGGNNGFHISDIEPFLKELEKENKILCRPTISMDRYFKINN